MGLPRVSVITPTFNRVGFLSIAIDSVLAQTFGDFEHIIIDDGSTDQTQQLLERYSADPRIRCFHQINQGQSSARNAGLEKSRGDFICFLDSDNAWLPNKLAASLAVFERHPEVDVVYGDVVTIDEYGKELTRRNMRRHSGRIVQHMLRDNCVSMNTTMARRRCFEELGGFSSRWRVADDYDLWLRFSAYYNFRYIPEYFALYRVMDAQISSDKILRLDTNEKILRAFLDEHGHRVHWAEARKGMSAFFARKGRYLADSGLRSEALRCYARALKQNPVSPYGWRALAKWVAFWRRN